MTDGGQRAGGKGDWSGRLLDGRYRVERVLGAGGMGTVYLARDERMQRPVVVKVPHARLLDDEQFRARFAKEIRSLTSLPHPHVVTVLDAGETRDDARAADDEATPFAVLAFLEGGSLKDRLERTLQSPEEVLAWLPDVAKALDFIHGQGVVHRDIKPGNVLFDRTGNAVVADFGIAKALGTLDTGLTRTGFTPGSPPYMGPEVGMGLPLGPGYDEYALGVLVYEALSGALPHEGTSGEVLIAKKAYVEPIDLGAKAPNVPTAARAAVMKAIARRPEDRFASCRAFADAFVEGVRAPAAVPAPVPPPPALPKFPADAPGPSRGAPREATRVGTPRSGRRVRLAVAVLAILGGGAFFALRRPAETVLPTAPGPGVARAPVAVVRDLVVEEPLEGALTASHEVRVAGRLVAEVGDLLQVEGVPVPITAGRFSVPLTVSNDGERTIEVTLRPASDPRRHVERRKVVVDTTKPVVEISAPANRAGTYPASTASATIAGRVIDAHPKAVRVGSSEVPLAPDGTFETTIPLVAGSQVIAIVATDLGGHVSDAVPVTLVREQAPPPPPPRAAWADDVAAATSSALSDDMPAASAAWDRAAAKGATTPDAPAGLLPRMAKWQAPPDLAVTEPDDGTRVTANPLRIRGELRAGRTTDEVVVNGVVVRTGPGAFETSVTLAQAGAHRVNVSVRDGGVARGSAVERRVVYAAPTTLAYEAYLRGFAVAVGAEIDGATGYPKKIRRLKDDGEMVLIPAGTFQMGAVPGDSAASRDEQPRHAVTLSKAYYLDVNEVTVGQWKKFVSGGGGRMPTDLRSESTDRHPIHRVDHTEATAFATWAGGALPTEAQWERAAKGGHDDFVYPWGATDDVKQRNGREDNDGFTALAPVRSFSPNDYGLYDVSGNVWEWCSDWYDGSYYAASPSRDPSGPGSGSARAARGGSWDGDGGLLRASFRFFVFPAGRLVNLGLRLARSL